MSLAEALRTQRYLGLVDEASNQKPLRAWRLGESRGPGFAITSYVGGVQAVGDCPIGFDAANTLPELVPAGFRWFFQLCIKIDKVARHVLF